MSDRVAALPRARGGRRRCALPRENDSQIIVRRGGIHRVRERFVRFVIAMLFREDHAEIDPRALMLGLQVDRLPRRRFGFVDFAALELKVGVVVPKLGVFRVFLERGFVFRRGPLLIAEMFVERRQTQADAGMIGLQTASPFILFDRRQVIGVCFHLTRRRQASVGRGTCRRGRRRRSLRRRLLFGLRRALVRCRRFRRLKRQAGAAGINTQQQQRCGAAKPSYGDGHSLVRSESEAARRTRATMVHGRTPPGFSSREARRSHRRRARMPSRRRCDRLWWLVRGGRLVVRGAWFGVLRFSTRY